MAGRKGKRTFVSLISSSEEEEEEEEEEDDEYDDDDESDEEEEEMNVSTSSDNGSDWSDEEDEEEEESDDQKSSDDDNDHHDDDDDDDDSLCHRVIGLLRERSDLRALNLKECKAYLRKHGLRITGTKAVCIQRIKEHWRLKDGNGEALYPRSSFVLNCTGDVCKGDVVLFTQKVYEKFDKVTRSGKLLGKRTIAGRVVKESYGAAKQQHTFTVEILWSKGIKKLPPLFPLLVKGRNLYKLNTLRQRWNNEAERFRVLAEKHKRGKAARLVRAMKKTKKTWSANEGAKRQKHFHHTGSSRIRQTTGPEKGKRVDGHGKAPSHGHAKSNNHRQKSPPVGQVNLKQITKSGAPKSSRRHEKLAHPNKDRDPTFKSYTDPPQDFNQSYMEFHHRSAPFHFSSCGAGSTSTAMRSLPFRHYADSSVMPAPRYQGFKHGTYTHHAYLNPSYEFEPRNLDRFPEQMNIYRPLHPLPLGAETYGQRSGFSSCSTLGCHDLGSENCVISSCWKCCRRAGRRCLVHQLHPSF